jgi:ribosomal-protein-alanine N-acetyltransferase
MLAINFRPFPDLTTERLCFRQLAAADAEEIFKLRSDERVNKFLTRNQYMTREEAGAFINKINRSISNNESIYWGIALKKDNVLIGTICLWNIQPENHRAEMGYELNPDHWGKGIMKEALPAIIEYGFETMKLHSIEADLDPGNSQSVTLLEKNGFIKEGHFKESTFFNGKFSDRAVYSLINVKDKIG